MKKPLEYYTYSTPKVRVYWNGHMQSPAYCSALEAKAYIEKNNYVFGTFTIKAEGKTVYTFKRK